MLPSINCWCVSRRSKMSWKSGRVIGDQDCKTHPRQPTNQTPTKAQLLFRFGRITSLVHRPLGSEKVSMYKIRDFVYCSDRRKKTEVGYFAGLVKGEKRSRGTRMRGRKRNPMDARRTRTGTRAYDFVEKRERLDKRVGRATAAGNFDEIG